MFPQHDLPLPPTLLLPQGLIPRGGELIKLGGSLFLAFLPFMLAFSLLFTGVYAVRRGSRKTRKFTSHCRPSLFFASLDTAYHPPRPLPWIHPSIPSLYCLNT